MRLYMQMVRSGRVELPLSAPEANVLSTGLRARVHCEQRIVYHEKPGIVNFRGGQGSVRMRPPEARRFSMKSQTWSVRAASTR